MKRKKKKKERKKRKRLIKKKEKENICKLSYFLFFFIIYLFFQCGKVIKATQAAYTFLETHPDDKLMLSNMKFYKSLAMVTDDLVFSLEPVPHISLYFKAAKFYENQDWTETINAFEETLAEYYKAYKECQYKCEEEREKNVFLGKAGLFDVYVDVMRCRSECPARLATIHGNVVSNYLPRHYNYLQMAYWKGAVTVLMFIFHLLPCSFKCDFQSSKSVWN